MAVGDDGFVDDFCDCFDLSCGDWVVLDGLAEVGPVSEVVFEELAGTVGDPEFGASLGVCAG